MAISPQWRVHADCQCNIGRVSSQRRSSTPGSASSQRSGENITFVKRVTSWEKYFSYVFSLNSVSTLPFPLSRSFQRLIVFSSQGW